MLAVLRACCCLAWLLLRCGEGLPEQPPDRPGADGQRPDTDVDAPSAGAEKPSDAFSFLRELQAFLGDVFPLPPGEAVSLRVQLPSLKSLPSLALGPASSETLLVGLLNSSSPTFFSFPPLRSVRRLGRGGELALPPDLLEELRRKLGTLEQQVEVLMGEVAVEQKAVRSLERLKALSALPREVRPAGELQYRAFLLMLALQTVSQAYEIQRGLRAARAGQASESNICRVQEHYMQLETYVLSPCRASIKKCTGVCSFPLHNPTNHAVVIFDQIQSGALLDSSVCCVPVAYDSLRVVELMDDGTTLSHVKENMFAKECGCR
ncbi:muellerian-inhibiting factor [Gadus morhua]|uniref:muellerian-inhibiting factor n=1 Tax=Gadus morhua TaxID=8049 RepID=UPI0011B5BDA5|nr:uncharacterized protein LOC115556041 [Gadus morhua]